MTFRNLVLCAFFACAAPLSAQASDTSFTAQVSDLTKSVDADVGIALVSNDGKLLREFNSGKRFAMCSTFKLPLAAMALQDARQGKYRLDHPLKFKKSDLDAYAPVATRYLPSGHMTVLEAVHASVQLSDNTAANLLLRQAGGPKVLTQAFRRWGDNVSRLDRNEPTLNTNLPGDPRDTSTPVAMAKLTARLVYGTLLDKQDRLSLERLLIGNQTGDNTIRAGVPSSWIVGDKTGSCERGGRNDLAFLRSPAGKKYVLAVYVNAPKIEAPKRDQLVAEITKLALIGF